VHRSRVRSCVCEGIYIYTYSTHDCIHESPKVFSRFFPRISETMFRGKNLEKMILSNRGAIKHHTVSPQVPTNSSSTMPSIVATGLAGGSIHLQVDSSNLSANYMKDLVRAHIVETKGIPAWALNIHQLDADDNTETDTETDVTSFTFAIDYGIVMVWNRNTLSAHGELKGDLIWTLNHDEESFVFRDPTSENCLIQVFRHKINYCEYSEIHKIDIRTGRRTEVTKLPTLRRQKHATCMNLLPNSTLLVVTWCGGKMYIIDTSAVTEHDPIVCTYTLPNDTADKGYSDRFDKNGDEAFNNDMFLSQPVLWENDPSLLVLVCTNLCIRLINCSARIGTSVWASEDHMAPVKNVRREQSLVVGMSEQSVFMWEDVSNEDITHGRITAVNLAGTVARYSTPSLRQTIRITLSWENVCSPYHAVKAASTASSVCTTSLEQSLKNITPTVATTSTSWTACTWSSLTTGAGMLLHQTIRTGCV
jgi:hypothetical protein